MRRRDALAGLAVLAAAGPVAAQTPGAGAARLPDPLGEMDVTLTDDRGRRVRPADLLGRPALVFFGFTHCPDICPTTLLRVSGWRDEIGSSAERLQIVLITVDAERDTPEALAEYVAAFDPDLRGWTGSEEEIARAAAAFGVAYRRVPIEGGDYTMEHTATVFLFSADGRFRSAIDYHGPEEFAVSKLRRLLDRVD